LWLTRAGVSVCLWLHKATAGPAWFDMPAPVVTPELKRDLQLLKLRNVLDPKRFYKRDGDRGLPKFFQARSDDPRCAREALCSDLKGAVCVGGGGARGAQVGTVVESGADWYSGRVPKRARKGTIVEELLADDQSRAYFKRRFGEVQARQQARGRRPRRAGKAGGRR
jgi:hypothetical protein